MVAKVWFVGEGNNELGRPDGYGKRHRGVLEALLVRVREGGWECAGAMQWHAIKKFRAGGARLAGPSHGDYFNVLGLVLAAYERAADVVVFSRDVDNDLGREDAVDRALVWIRDESGIDLKSTDHYVDVVEQAELGEAPHFGLPSGAESLRAWLATAHDVLHRLVHGRTAS